MAQQKSKFISYISQSVLEGGSRKASFKSYIDNGTPEDGLNDDIEDENLTEVASEFFDMDLQPNTLPGETQVGMADNVLKFTPYSEGKQGMSGKLCATNFKLAFVTADRSSYEMPGKRKRNKLMEETDIPLTSIDAIYQVSSTGKRKMLTQGTTVSSSTKILEVHCKDFRIHTFSFKFTPKTQNKPFVNTLVHYAFPKKDELLFAYEYGRNNKASEAQLVCNMPMFDTIFDWEEELKRCNCEKYWRVTDANLSFDMSQSLPQYFVVPQSLLNTDIKKAAPQFHQRRVPTWCYTHTNKNSLVRMSSEDGGMDHPQFKEKMLNAVKVSGRHQNTPKVINLAESCPSCKDVQEAYSKLKKICMSDTQREYLVQDLTWYQSVDETRWLQYVAQCLSVSQEAANVIIEKKRTVILEEKNGWDFSCLVSSLVQILLDPYYRSQVGFQALIQKEWVRMGHPFQTYLGLVYNGEPEQVPIFLLFLDCTWQLLQQYPSCFEFSETYLTSIWDSAFVGIFDTFLFDNDNQRLNFAKNDSKNIRRFRLPPVWKWDLQFTAEDLSFFKDPLYVLTHDNQLKSLLSDLRHLSVPGMRSKDLRSNAYARKLNKIYEREDNEVACPDILTPNFCAPVIQLWKQCYLRWQALAQIFSGGSPSQYLQQCHMVEEIIQLNHKAKILQERTASQGFRPSSDLIFGQGGRNIQTLNELLSSTYLTSSFPFCPSPSLRDQQMMTFTPTISVYLRHSSLEFDRVMDDE